MARLAAQGLDPVELTGGPWAIRYSLSHLVKDEALLAPADWVRTKRILSHGSLAAGFLTGRFDSVSVSSAASTGIMDLRTRQWRAEMLQALDSPIYRAMALAQLPRIERDDCAPIGLLSPNLAQEAGIAHEHRPMIFPTSDDQQAGLVGGGAVDAGQLAVILGNSAVVNSSSSSLPQSSALDAMRLNWGPYLWMRCYTNGAQFLDHVVGRDADFEALEYLARQVPAGCNGVMVLPFVYAEPSLNVATPYLKWIPAMPTDPGVRYRAALEALAYLIAVGVYEHEHAGQKISRVTMSGGIARSELMGEILATVAHRPMERIASAEGPALGAAVTALSALETHLRRQRGIHEPFSVADAVASMVQFRGTVNPREDSRRVYAEGLQRFRNEIGHLT
jgi:sugar (pentulose or hexulose) kinase